MKGLLLGTLFVLLCAYLALTQIVLSNKQDKYIRRRDMDDRILFGKLATISRKSVSICAQACSTDADCHSFFYNKTIKLCLVVGTNITVEVTNTLFLPGWTYYIHEDKVATDYKECLLTEAGWEYTGTRNVTEKGQPCRPWPTSLAGNQNGEHQNFCRNNARTTTTKPYCYTGPSDWEYCDIPSCGVTNYERKECLLTPVGKEYLGTTNVTEDGSPCLRWDRKGRGDLKEHENYCRNPNLLRAPYCVVDPVYEGIKYCNITLC